MGDYWNTPMDPDSHGQHYEQGFQQSPRTPLPTVQQTQDYEQGFWEPLQPPPPSDQHIPMPSPMVNRASRYDSRPNRLQPQDSYLGPSNQHPYLHGSDIVQPTPRRWDPDVATQSPPRSDARGRTPGSNSNIGGRSDQQPRVQHPYQPVAPSRRLGTEGAEGISLPSFQMLLANIHVHRGLSKPASPVLTPGSNHDQLNRNVPRRASPYPIPARIQVQRNVPRNNSSPYQLHYGGQQAGVSQMLAPMHPPPIGQPPLSLFTPSQSPQTLGPCRPPEHSTRGSPSPSMVAFGANRVLEANGEQSVRPGTRPSWHGYSATSNISTPLPIEPHQDLQTEGTTQLPEHLRTVRRSHPMPTLTGSHIQEANFTSVGGSYIDHRRVQIQNYNPGPENDPRRDFGNRNPIDELGKTSALGAIANAEERAYAPRCLHKTRNRVLEDLGEWSAAEGKWKDAKLLVLTGPAGHGKTAIMQSFSETLLRQSRETRVVVATFFFKATIPDQNQPKALVTTLAYQVAEHWPSFQDNIVSVIRDNVRILSTSLEHQMDHLLTGPIVRSNASPPSPPFIVICAVDGLDECAGDDDQDRVIRLLHTLSMTPNTRVVLASRPEFPIQSALEGGLLETLHVDLNKVYDASKDIRQFTWIRLSEIRDRLLPKLDRVSWPRKEDAEQIANYSSGQFILADTAMRYVDDRHYDPRERLKEVLALCGGAGDPCATMPVAAGRGSTQPLGTLDALFTGILKRAAQNAYPDMEPEQAVLELASLVWILIGLVPSRMEAASRRTDFVSHISLWVTGEALNRQSGDLARELSDLHSLLDVPQDMDGRNTIRAHHKSFLDFLEDPKRSGHFGNVAQVAQEQFDQMIKTHLLSLTVNDLKNLMLAQGVKPHILHSLHLLSKPETVIESIDRKVWKALLPSLNAWEMLLVKQWVHVGLSRGYQALNFMHSRALQMMDEACKRSLDDLLPWLGNQDPLDPPPISDVNIELFFATLGGQGDQNLGCEHSEFIPKERTGPFSLEATPSFPWFPAACTLAWLWASRHRLIPSHSRVTQPSDTSNLHPQKSSQIVFIIGPAGSGKRELLEQAYKLLPAGKEDGPPEGWMPPVDIIIVPDMDGLSLRMLWAPGAFATSLLDNPPCNNQDLTGKIDLSHQIPTSLFQDCIRCWKDKHEKNTYHPQFLLQGLHLLSPEDQASLLDVILSDVEKSDSTGRPPLFITVTSILTATLASKLRQISWPGVYYVNLDGMKADTSLLEETLLRHRPLDFPLLKIHKLAQILASSPKPARHLKRLTNHLERDRWSGWENCLALTLAAPESKAWRLIEEHFEEIP